MRGRAMGKTSQAKSKTCPIPSLPSAVPAMPVPSSACVSGRSLECAHASSPDGASAQSASGGRSRGRRIVAYARLALPPQSHPPNVLRCRVARLSGSHQFIRCTQNRWFVTRVAASAFYFRPELGIRNMRGVPCQEIVDAMARGNCDVQGIGCRMFWKTSRRCNPFRQSNRLVRNDERGQVLHPVRAPLGSVSIAQSTFGNDQLRYVYTSNVGLRSVHQ